MVGVCVWWGVYGGYIGGCICGGGCGGRLDVWGFSGVGGAVRAAHTLPPWHAADGGVRVLVPCAGAAAGGTQLWPALNMGVRSAARPVHPSC